MNVLQEPAEQPRMFVFFRLTISLVFPEDDRSVDEEDEPDGDEDDSGDYNTIWSERIEISTLYATSSSVNPENLDGQKACDIKVITHSRPPR